MSYRNPVTYVDSESGKYFASAIQNISNTTAGVINKLGAKAEEERKKKEAENLKLLNDTTKFNLDYLNSANLASKDFDLQPSLQPALSSLVDQAAKIKAKLFNSKNPAERSSLQSQLAKYENFFKGGGMKDLLETFQEKRELYSKIGVVGKAGSEGGIDLQKIDPELSKFFLSTYNDRLPSDLGIEITDNNGVFDIVLNSSGGVFGKEGSYQQSLMGLMSAELPVIPNITAESNESLIEEKLINKNGIANLQGQASSYLTTGSKRTIGSKTIETYSFNEENRARFRKDMGRNVLSTIAGYSNQGTLMDGPGVGFNALESYYNNVLRSEGDPDLEIGNAQGTSLDEKSLEIVKNKMLDKLEEKFENSIPKDLYRTPKESNNNTPDKYTNMSAKESAEEIYKEFARDPLGAYNRYKQGPEEKATLVEGSIITIPQFDNEGNEEEPLRYNMDNKQERGIFFQELLNVSKLAGGDDKGRAIRLLYPSLVDEMSDKYIKEKTKKSKKKLPIIQDKQ